jgi:uncharacterized protein with GYD domain
LTLIEIFVIFKIEKISLRCDGAVLNSIKISSPFLIHFIKINERSIIMQTYILLTKLSPEISKQVKDRAKLGRAWLDQVKEKCPEVNFIAHYALLGSYDFIDIYEAPDETVAAKVSLISMSNGAFQAESLIAIPYKRFLKLTEEI